MQVVGNDIVISIDENAGLPIKDFIKLAENITGKKFTYSTQELQQSPDQNILWIGTMRIPRDEFFGFFQTMLYIKGFGIVVRGESDKGTEIIEIIYMSGPKRNEVAAGSRLVAPELIADYANQTGVSILTSVPLVHIRATAATNALRPFFLPTAAGTAALTIGNVGSENALLLQGFGPQVYAAYQLIKLVDVPPEAPEQEFRVQPLQYQAAEEIEPILNEILGRRPGAGAPAAGVSGGDLVAGQQTQLKIMAHAPLNAIILSGTNQQILEAQDILAKLDMPSETTDGDSHVYRVRNVLATELQETLREFITEDLAAEQQAQAGQTGGGGVVGRRPRKTVVVAHEASNSLLVSATASRWRSLESTIQQLDQRQAQVLIEAAVIELTTTDNQLFGIELGLLDIKNQGDFTRPFGFTHFGQSVFQDTDDNGLPDTRLPDFENPQQGLTGGIITSDDFAIPVLVNALASDNRANVLSLPSVVVNNNQNAQVQSLESRPVQTQSQGNVTTQSGFGGFEPAGIDLNISPSISSNNYLRLNVSLNVSRFTTAFDPTSVTPGVKAQRVINTQVTLPSGATMVLGGVIDDTESSESRGVPFLKDIPILGYLFSSGSSTKTKTNLYFFITPTILNEEDFTDLADVSFRKKLQAAKYIGNQRLQLIDPTWRAGRAETLEDTGATIEDIDALGGFGFPMYQRPGSGTSPGAKNGTSPDGDASRPRASHTAPNGPTLPPDAPERATRPRAN